MNAQSKISLSTDLRDGLCFGCGRKNPIGLKLNFKWDGKTARTEFTPARFYQGWPGLLHGGIIATLLDEAMSYAVRFNGLDFLTARIQTNYKRPIKIEESLVIAGSIIRKKGRYIEAKASVSLSDSTVMAEGTGTFVVIEANQHNTSNNEEESERDVQR